MTRRKIDGAKQLIYYRNYRRARDKALSRLAHAYPETYKELLEQEKVNDQATSEKWVAITDSSTLITNAGADDRTDDASGRSADHYKEDKSDRGGEA